MNLPADASQDQSNCPQGYYRRSNGMLHQIGETKATPSDTCQHCQRRDPTSEEVAKLEAMDRVELVALVRRIYKAGWGYGKLTGKDLLEMALKTKDEAYEALKLTALTLAHNAKDWREFHALATFWSERERGKPVQSVNANVTIGVLEIVDEIDKRRKEKVIDITPTTT